MNEMTEVLCGTAPESVHRAFFERGIKLRETGACMCLEAPVAGHIDLMTAFLCGKQYAARQSPELLQKRADNIIDENLGTKYPQDVPLSAEQIGDWFLCNRRTVAEILLQDAEKSGLKIIDVAQGYVSCSLCRAGENAVITDDPSIADALERDGKIQVLKIEKGDILLPGYGYGFIGGASGWIGDTLYFFGDIQTHRDGEKIREFLERRGIHYECLLPSRKLIDIGSIING